MTELAATLTSQSSAPSLDPPLPEDPLMLNELLRELMRDQQERKRVGLVIPEGTPQAEADRLRREFNAQTATNTRRMITIITRLRKTSAGPAARGGKRAKAQPVDMTSFAMSLGLEKKD